MEPKPGKIYKNQHLTSYFQTQCYPGYQGKNSYVRENAGKNILPLITSNKKDKKSVIKAISSGATGYMIKPFPENAIVKKWSILHARAKSGK